MGDNVLRLHNPDCCEPMAAVGRGRGRGRGRARNILPYEDIYYQAQHAPLPPMPRPMEKLTASGMPLAPPCTHTDRVHGNMNVAATIMNLQAGQQRLKLNTPGSAPTAAAAAGSSQRVPSLKNVLPSQKEIAGKRKSLPQEGRELPPLVDISGIKNDPNSRYLVDEVKSLQARQQMQLLQQHMIDKVVPFNAVAPIFVDDPITNGIIGQLETNLNVWNEPCLIRLSDVLKKSPAFLSKRSLIEYISYLHKRPGIGSMRHYTLPQSHQDSPDCLCIFCQSCKETLKHMESVGFSPSYLAESLLHMICRRTKAILISQVQLAFQEETLDFNLEERLCYGFRNALPPVGIIHFEKLFRSMYKMGSEVMWDITKKLGVLIKYNPDYNAALHFLTFFSQACNRLSVAISRLRDDLDFFDWKLGLLAKINLKIFFVHIFESHLYSSQQFQNALAMCKQIVFKQRRFHPKRREEATTAELKFALGRIRKGALLGKKLWNEKKPFPFKFEEYTPLKHNLFKIASLRNPFEKLNRNDTQGYEVVRSTTTGQIEYRNIENHFIPSSSSAEPILDITMAKPGCTDEHFSIRAYRQSVKVSMGEIDTIIQNKDITFLEAHNYKFEMGTRMEDYFQEKYLTKRAKYNLDQVEGHLPPEIQSRFTTDFFYDVKQYFHHSRFSKRHHKTRDITWPSYFYMRRCRLSKAALKKKVLNRRRKMRRTACAGGTRCVGYERLGPHKRYYYSFGGLPETNTDSKSMLMESQKWEFTHEIITSALQLGLSSIRPASTDPNQQFRYFILFTHMDACAPKNLEREESKQETMYENLFDMIKIHYDVLAKYDLITLEDSQRSPHYQEQMWGESLIQFVSDEKICERLRMIEQSNVERPYRPMKDPSQTFVVNEPARKTGANKDGCTHSMSDSAKKRTNETLSTSGFWEEMEGQLGHSCPHGNGFRPERHDHMHTIPAHTYLPANTPQSSCHSGHQGGPKGPKCAEHEKKSSRPGLPVSVGYAEKRQNLRLKLAREKKEKEILKKEPIRCEDTGCYNCHNNGANMKKSKEIVTISAETGISQDIDEIVNLIEGIKVGSNSQHRNSSASESATDPKKAAKKARKKEKKEQQKLEQEEDEKLAKLEEELALLKEEEARVKREEEEREEELRKKREKRKKKKNKAKKSEMDEIDTQIDQLIKPNTGASSKLNTKLTVTNAAAGVSQLKNVPEQKTKTAESAKPDMVTIRRYATAPDTTVTISVKSDNGEEDVLYTLINGQVVRTDGRKTDTKPNGSQSPEPSIIAQNTDKKVKKKTKKLAQQEIEKESSKILPVSQIEASKVPLMQNVDNRKGGTTQPSNTSQETATRLSNNRLAGPSNSKAMDQSKQFLLQCDQGNHVDLTQLKLPPGITITKLTDHNPQPSHKKVPDNVVIVESRKTLSDQRKSGQVYVDEFADIEDCSYTAREAEDFEEVVSNKTRRLRNRVNKLKDGFDWEDEPSYLEAQAERIPRKWNNSDLTLISDSSIADAAKLNTNMTGNSSRGKRTSDGNPATSGNHEVIRNRKTSGGGRQNTGQIKFGGVAKSQHSPGTHNNSQSYSEQGDPSNNGRSGKYVRGNATTPTPRVKTTTPTPRVKTTTPTPRVKTTTPTPRVKTTTPTRPTPRVKTTQPEFPPVVSGTVSYNPFSSKIVQSPYPHRTPDSFDNYSRNGGIQYVQPIKKPVPTNQTDDKADVSRNGHQGFGITGGNGNSPNADFAEYNHWSGASIGGQQVDILGTLLKDLQVTENDSQFGFGYGVPNFSNDDGKSPMWNNTWGGGDNRSGAATPCSDYQMPGAVPFMLNQYQQPMYDTGGAGVIGGARSHSCDIGYQRSSFGENTYKGDGGVVQRPTPPPVTGPSFTPAFGQQQEYQFQSHQIKNPNPPQPSTSTSQTHAQSDYSLF